MSAKDHIMKSAALRAQGQYNDAIDEIEKNRAAFDDIALLPALLQAFYAAEESGDGATARKYAEEIKKEAPDLPSIQPYLT